MAEGGLKPNKQRIDQLTPIAFYTETNCYKYFKLSRENLSICSTETDNRPVNLQPFKKPENRIDLNSESSHHSGLKGIFESVLRKFKTATQIGLLMPMYVFTTMIFGAALFAPVLIVRSIYEYSQNFSFIWQSALMAFSLGLGYFCYGFSMIVVIPIVNFLFRGYLKAWKGPYYSIESVKWFIHNGLTYLIRFTFLEFVTPSPISNLFYQMMGMKIGKGVVINTTWISDPSMIELGNKVTLGGSVTIVAHYGQGGILILAPVKIGDNCTIGLKSSIMGGVTIGEGAKLLPHSVVMPKTVIPPGETWGGVPAQRVEIKKIYSNKKDGAA